MKKFYLKTFLTCLILVGLSGLHNFASATPSASDLLNACQQAFQTSGFQTQHVTYRVTTAVSSSASQATTNIQNIEIFKKRPSSLKMIMDNGYNSQTVIAQNGYLYVLSSTTGKYVPVKGTAPTDPFQQSIQTLSNFDTATVNQVSSTVYEITVTGGKLPVFVDHAMIRLDSSTNEITHVEGVDKSGKQVLNMNLTYQIVSGVLQVKHIDTQVSTKKISAATSMDVLNDEVNVNIDNSVFVIN